MTREPALPKLRSAIIEKFVTQSDFANAASTHTSYVSQVINGKDSASEAQKEHWAGLLGYSKEYLFEIVK
jgi:transcriptional regulator with XRE-family HTH domain